MSLLFVIGPLVVAQGYEIRDAPEAWQASPQGDLLCGKCGKSLSLAFDSPPASGEARCGCDDIGFRLFTQIKPKTQAALKPTKSESDRKAAPNPTKSESGDNANEPPVRSSIP